MDIYTLNRGFVRQDLIDEFESVIWTDRYYGDGDFKLSVPATDEMMAKLPKGQFMIHSESVEPMILETREIKDGLINTTGISLTQWLNNRFIRTSADHSVRDHHMVGYIPGEAIQAIVQFTCINSGPYLNGTIPIGIPVGLLDDLIIPGLSIAETDHTGPAVDFTVPFGPVYDAIKQIAETYEIGLKIELVFANEDNYMLTFEPYKGKDRTSSQAVNPVIQFSPEMESLTNITDLDSIADHKNYVFAFAPGADPAVATASGFSTTLPIGQSGFDLRAEELFADDISTDPPLTAAQLLNSLNQRAAGETTNKKIVQLVDGEIVPTGQIKYGTHYFMGDIVEVKGNTGILQKARITEYIRSQDSAGERAYPTLSMID